jgi:hypothetical protein
MDDPHNKQYTLVEYDDYWVIPLRGRPVSRFVVGYGLTIEFLDPENEQTIIMLAGEFHLEIDGKDFVLSHEEPTALGPALGLLGRAVESALAYKDGKLEVKFRGGAKLSVAPASNYESWNVTGTRWLRIVCMPGGDLAIWKPDPSGS